MLSDVKCLECFRKNLGPNQSESLFEIKTVAAELHVHVLNGTFLNPEMKGFKSQQKASIEALF